MNTYKIKSLNGQWKFIPDPDEKLSFAETENKLFDGTVNNTMQIPSNWQLQGLDNFNGTVWYFKEFTMDSKYSAGEINIVSFSGVDYFAEVWLNGSYIGSHEGYFQNFYFDITDSINYNGKNLLTVKVSSPKEEPGKVWPLNKKLIKGIFNHHDCRPGAWSLEYGQDKNTGGIWNNVEIITGQLLHVENIKITSALQNKNRKARVLVDISYSSRMTNPFTAKFKYEIKTPSGKTISGSYEQEFVPQKGSFSFAVAVDNPELWYSWDTGKQPLYELKMSTALSGENHSVFGIREVRLDDSSAFYINGKKLFLRGTNLIPTQFLSELNQQRISRLVTLMKEANINIVRVHAHVNRKELYDEFDKAGILVWQDFALQWTYDDGSEFATNAVSQIKDMARLHYNHPSIAFWCCHNEPGRQIETLDPFLRQAILSQDSTRIVRLASNYEEHPYDGWYWGSKEHFAAAPMGPLVTEFGAQALPSKKNLKTFLSEKELTESNWEAWQYHCFQYEQTFEIAGVKRGNSLDEFIENSQNYQSEYIRTAVEFYRRKKFNGITGIFQFMFADCWPSITWSVLDYNLEKKKGFETLKNVFQPVYISVNRRQKRHLKGGVLNIDICLINDLNIPIKKCRLTISVKKKILHSIENITLAENDLKFIGFENLNIKLPSELKTGKHRVDFVLTNKNSEKVISENYIDIDVVKKENLSWTKI
jgi:beta-mannosidase